ncbi:MAG: T9SS type A sorting domain-containing protein [Candidatus Stygibacter australis]|nr:T9SS type A sorting domain-containing protein [Candidatus Stygibacter australis]
MKKGKYIFSFLILLLTVNMPSQTIDFEVNEPFMTSYKVHYADCLRCYEDMAIYHAGWGIAVLDTDENNEIIELSRLYCEPFDSICRDGNYLYLSYTDNDDYEIDSPLIIRKIDITDQQNPELVDELELNTLAYSNNIHILDNYLYVMVYDQQEYYRIDINDFSQYDIHYLNSTNTETFGNYMLSYNEEDQFIVYQSIEDSLEIIADNIDLFGPHQNQTIKNIKWLAENHVCTIATNSLILWDISDITNWQQTDFFTIPEYSGINWSGEIVIKDSSVYLNTIENIYQLELDEDYQIGNVIVHVPECEISAYTIGNINNKLLIPSGLEGIGKFNIEDNNFIWEGFFYDNPYLFSQHIIGDEYFLMSESFYNYEGIKHYNLSNPEEPELLDILLPYDNYIFMYNSKNFFFMHDYVENEVWNVYQYQDSELQLLTTISLDEYSDVFFNIYTDEFDEDTFYLINSQTGELLKYQVNNETADIVLESTFADQEIGFISNGYGYFFRETGNSYDLVTYNGFFDNQPAIFNEYQNITNGIYAEIGYIDSDYLYITTLDSECEVFGYANGELTGQSYLLSTFNAKPDFFYHDYLICHDYNMLHVYQVSETTSGYIEPAQSLSISYFINDLDLYESESGDYIFCFGPSAVSVIEIEVVNDVLDMEILDSPISIKVYPNPFYFTGNEEITFDLEESNTRQLESANISIYNIKGQLIHQQKSNSSISWDCRFDNGIKVPSGVYLYRVDAREKSSVGKFIITK